MISPLAHEAIVRISHGIPLATPTSLSHPSCFSSFSFSALLAAINPFSSAGCNDTAIGGTLSRTRGPCPCEFMDEYRGEESYRYLPRGLHEWPAIYASSAVALVCGACGCSQMFTESERAQDVHARVLKRRDIPTISLSLSVHRR